jgi:hypothetical protein
LEEHNANAITVDFYEGKCVDDMKSIETMQFIKKLCGYRSTAIRKLPAIDVVLLATIFWLWKKGTGDE